MFDLIGLIKSVGYLGIFAIVFAESGLFIGFFLPGDSLLFTAGLLASQGFFNLFVLMIVCVVGAILGDNFGYAFGRRVGPKIFTQSDSLFFHRDHLDKAKVFYEKYGRLTIILARFMPLVRTFAPILAGVGRMPYPIFAAYNIIGGLIWGVSLPLLGYFLGRLIPDIDRYILPAISLIVLISLIPIIRELLKNYLNKKRKI